MQCIKKMKQQGFQNQLTIQTCSLVYCFRKERRSTNISWKNHHHDVYTIHFIFIWGKVSFPHDVEKLELNLLFPHIPSSLGTNTKIPNFEHSEH